MGSTLSPKQIAFDAAVKARNNFLHRGIANLDQVRQENPEDGPLFDQLVELRSIFNSALEDAQRVGESTLYFDYVDSDESNSFAFGDAEHWFIGVTLKRISDIRDIGRRLAASDAVVRAIGLPASTDRAMLQGVLSWMLLGFSVAHEFTHHDHRHRFLASRGLQRQGIELDADGWAASLTMNVWVLAGGRPAVISLLLLDEAPPSAQDDVLFTCFIIAQAALVFLREPIPLDKAAVYTDSHPSDPVRLQVMSRFVIKFIDDFRSEVRETITQQRYQRLMDAASQAMWTEGAHAARWREYQQFLRTPEGTAYLNALLAELDTFRATLRERADDSESSAAP